MKNKRVIYILFIVIIFIFLFSIYFYKKVYSKKITTIDEFKEVTGINLVVENNNLIEQEELISLIYSCYEKNLNKNLKKYIHSIKVELKNVSDKRIGGSDNSGEITIYLYNETKDICLGLVHESVHVFIFKNPEILDEWNNISLKGFLGRDYFINSFIKNNSIIIYNVSSGKAIYFDGRENVSEYGLIEAYGGVSAEEDIATFVTAFILNDNVNWSQLIKLHQYKEVYEKKIDYLKRIKLI